jgi:CubicO group peptidase (beta-lactamase class C family)
MEFRARPLVFAALLALAADARAESQTAAFERYMDACVKVNRFSGCVLVAKEGKILFRRGYGLANAEHDVENTPETKFRLGSITKQFTAMAVMILSEQGKIRLDDPVGKYLTDAPKAWEGVTIHHLLSHTGGVPSYTSDPGYLAMMTYPVTVRSMIGRFRDKPLEFKPGQKFAYSNSGYFLLGAVIEKVTGKSYETFLKEAIFDPLGMKDTGYDWPKTLLKNRASGYTLTANGLENAAYLDMGQPYAAGSLYSTVDDLARWDGALTEGKLISRESYARMFTPVKSDYAYGWGVTTRGGRKEISHGGGINGFVTQILRYPEKKVCVVVLCNVLPQNPGKVAHDLAAITFGEPYKVPVERKPVKVDSKVYDAYAGRYRLSRDVTVTVTREGDRLMIQPTGQPKLELVPESETRFFIKIVDADVRFIKDAKGKVTHVVINRGKDEDKAERIEATDGGTPKSAAPSR